MLRCSVVVLMTALSVACVSGHSGEDKRNIAVAYQQGQFERVERIVSNQAAGYSDFQLFPYSINVLVNSGLANADKEKFARAEAAVMKMRPGFPAETQLSAYQAFIPHLAKHGQGLRFAASPSDCGGGEELLDSMVKVAFWDRDPAKLEGVKWYSAYLASKCPSSTVIAAYIGSSAELSHAPIDLGVLDSPRAAGAGVRAADVVTELCALRKVDGRYDLSELKKQEDAGVFICDRSS